MKPYPLEASNHLMTPVTSTRLAPASSNSEPSPENGLSAPSWRAPPRSPDRIRPGDPPGPGTPSFLDSNPSPHPLTPDPPHPIQTPPRAGANHASFENRL